MPKPLSMDLQERLISSVEDGMSRRSAAKLFSVAPSTAIKWVDQKRCAGSVRPRAELAEHLQKTYGLKVAPSTIWRLLDRHDMT